MTGDPEPARADDDALADAILASFTSAIPVAAPRQDAAPEPEESPATDAPWSTAPAPAAAFTSTAQFPLPPVELLQVVVASQVVVESPDVVESPVVIEPPSSTDDDSIGARLRALAPPDPAAAVPLESVVAAPPGSFDADSSGVSAGDGAVIGPAEVDDWSAAPPPAFAPPALVEPPARAFAAPVAPAPAASARTVSATPAPEPPTPVPSAPAPVRDDLDLSAYGAPTGPASGVITLPPEAWLAAHPPAAPRLALDPTLDLGAVDARSLVDPRLSAAATSDSGYSDDDDGSVDPEDRAAVPWPADEVDSTDASRAATTAAAVAEIDSSAPLSAPAAASAGTPSTPISGAGLPRMFSIEFAAVEPVPAEQRAGGAGRMFWLAVAPSTSLLLLGVGSGLVAAGASLRQAVIALVIGAALSCLPIALAVLAARWSGQPALITSRAVFGVVGNAVPALLAVVTRAGWAGALLWLTADAVGGAASTAELGDPAPIRVIALLAGILLAGVISVLGYGLLTLVQAVAAVAGSVAVATIIVLTAGRVDLTRALAAGDGPWALVIGGVVLVVAVAGLALVQSIGDLARYQRPGRSAGPHLLGAAIGSALPTLALSGWGALLAASDRELARGLTEAPVSTLTTLLPSSAAVPLLAAVALSGVAGAAVAAYSGGLAISSAGVRAPRPVVTLPAVLVAALLAVLLLAARVDAPTLLRDLAVTMAVPVAAWAGLVGGDLLRRSRRLHAPSLLRRGGVYPDARVGALTMLVVLVAVGWMLVDSTLPVLAWQGALLPLLGPDLAAADPGVLVALLGGLLSGMALGGRAVRRQEVAVVEPVLLDS